MSPQEPPEHDPPAQQAVPQDATAQVRETVVRRKPAQPAGGRSNALVWAAVLLVLGGVVALGLSWVTGRATEPQSPDGATTAGAPAPATPLLSARRVPDFTTAMIPLRSMAAAVDPVVQAAPPDTCLGVGDGERSLYLHNGEAPLVPASNQKLLTASAALDLLGPEDTLKTTFAAATAPTGGVVEGDLFMIGGGDPVLTTEPYQARQRHGRFPETDLEAVADGLVDDGLVQVTGSVVGDAGRYDDQRSLPDWKERWLSGGTVAPLSALLVNDGWLIDPVTGEGPGGPAPDPAQHAAAVMTRLLTDRGVVIGGEPRSGAAPADPEVIAQIASPPMTTLVEQLLAFSDNTTAELLLKEMGVRSGDGGSTAQGIAAVTGWAGKEGLAEEGWVMVDGSGLSSGNRVSCTMLAALLRRAGADSPLADGLAVPGEPGTLEDRFGEGGLPERLRAKTGTLNDVSALSGWFVGADDTPLDFEFVLNTTDRNVTTKDVGLQKQLLDALVGQPVAPPLEAAGPLPVPDG